MDKKLEKELKKAIKEELGNCNEELWPSLCSLRKTKEGYSKVETMIVHYVANEGMEIGTAIAHIEQELSHIKR